jgi:steroid 5-alpha reductase family enzyme
MMSFIEIYLYTLLSILGLMSTLWVISIFLKNVSIVDLFWGAGFVLVSGFYYYYGSGLPDRKTIILILVALWGFRLSLYLAWRNIGKGEDFRYREFRKKYGENRYWWVSFFQTFLLQGILMWLISAPLLGAMHRGQGIVLNFLDCAGLILWVIGFIFEAGGDFQLARFKANPANQGKILNKGFWRYTRHPNYFGDAAIWWGYGFLSLAADSYLPVLGSILMTLLIIKVSGVALLEKSLNESKPEYREYIRRTSAFIPWFPKK